MLRALSRESKKHRLMDELAALSAIRSKYVVQVLDVIYDGGEIVGLVEEFIDGPDLAPLPAPIDMTAALRALYPMFAGIAEVHAHSRLHRDLKPENMKFDGAGVLKLFDFGLAKLATDAKTQVLYYTKGYAAPEIFQTDASGNHNFTTAVDVFAIGVSSLWLLGGGKIPAELYHIPPTLPCFDFAALGIAFPPSIATVMNRTIAQSPKDRPSAEEVRLVLSRQLLFDKHRMLITNGAQVHSLSALSRNVKLTVGSDTVSLKYDGYDFSVTAVSGHVRRNNKQMIVGDKLVGASVIVLGPPNGYRTSITADVSHPEVVL
ncbi:protein kinase domain-containing protein [Mesorhizobium sp. LjNodule214]|uniref:protein kinase domain-containing protein n=1 Tax=Mesorhizobium sp. LjNodule214 TaxID=3342252 RepID=UPI003ECFF328